MLWDKEVLALGGTEVPEFTLASFSTLTSSVNLRETPGRGSGEPTRAVLHSRVPAGHPGRQQGTLVSGQTPRSNNDSVSLGLYVFALSKSFICLLLSLKGRKGDWIYLAG